MTDDLPSAWFKVENVNFCSKEVNFHKAVKLRKKFIFYFDFYQKI